MKYYSRLKSLRQEAKMSQADVAKVLNCSQVGYGMYELGKRKISVEKMMVLARLYHVSLDYMVGLTDERQGQVVWDDAGQEEF
ncbi:helix-turn-helix domain-containing protein [uncultured Megasphaera sp.]|uniref:helix-turn-helix domain-containing protein n=1 Tax=uncultured Megasphaera sp. TaxID=165188 RepID=UPI002658B7C4|nr:helix-turn-helix transcriptional regulator [uncultured Megasphaera sp.]